MQSSSAGHPAGPLYALVSYIPGPLGQFLNSLRGQLVSQCRLQAHLTLLPPRVLHSPQVLLSKDLDLLLRGIPSFEIALGDVETFESTKVIYLGIRHGETLLREIHSFLCQGRLEYEELYEFHPHITLAQDFPHSSFEELKDFARNQWSAWQGSKTFQVENLVFVRNRDASTWETVSEHALQPLPLIRTA